MSEETVAGGETIRVVVVDDHAVTLAGIRTVLDAAERIEVVGTAECGAEAEALVRDLRPDILLLDLVLPDRRPYDVERWVREHYPETVTLILTAHDRDALLSQAVDHDVSGYLTKDQATPALISAIRQAASGETLLTEEQLRRAHRWQAEIGSRLARLTDRERAVLKLVGQGLSNDVIGEALEISPHTVRAHLRRIYKKLDVKNRSAAVAFARDVGPELGTLQP